MINIREADRIVESLVSPLGAENVRLSDALGRVLAEDVVADLDLPPFDRSQMDGFAVRSRDTSDAPVWLDIVGESAAGSGWDGILGPGQAVKTMTGARVPGGADAVQQIELASVENGRVKISEPAPEGKNIVAEASEITKGTPVLSAGTRIEPGMIASLAAFGYSEVRVGKRPRLAVLSTGSEIVDVAEVPGLDQIRNSNSAMLAAFASAIAEVTVLPIAPDDPEGVRLAIVSALEVCDVLVTSGGVSVGDYDFTKPVIRELGAEIHFERLALKPGKPTVFATVEGKHIFGLPGNPVSIAVTFLLFVRKALLLMQGASDPDLKRGRATVAHDIKGTHGRDGMLPVKMGFSEDGRMVVESLRFRGSSNFVTFAGADAIAFVPAGKGLSAGDVTDIYFF